MVGSRVDGAVGRRMTTESRAVADFLAGVEPPKRRRDADVLIDLMHRVTGEPPLLWSTSIVGFGCYEYQYESGRRGEAPAASFSPRKAATSIYLSDGIGAHEDELRLLGPHTTGVGCVYVKDLSVVDLDVLKHIVGNSYATLIALDRSRLSNLRGEVRHAL